LFSEVYPEKMGAENLLISIHPFDAQLPELFPMKKIRSILVANRSEIAIRVLRAASEPVGAAVAVVCA